MNEQECLSRMVAPGTRRAGKYREGVVQVLVTSSCDLACFNCTQASQLSRPKWFMTPEQFEQAVLSLKGYFGVYGVFGGNPCLSPHFDAYCDILRKHVPFQQRGLWSNNPLGKGKTCRATFDPSISNLNVHLSQKAYDEWKRDWPESNPVGLHEDSRHSPPFVAMKDVLPDEGRRWELISTCDINQHWSAMIGVFRGQLRAWFCEVAGAQAILHQDDLEYPDTGYDIERTISFTEDRRNPLVPKERIAWWQLPMTAFADQVRKHCHECSVPLRGYGELAQGREGREQTSATHADVYRPKKPNRQVEVVTDLVQLNVGRINRVHSYLQNAKV